MQTLGVALYSASIGACFVMAALALKHRRTSRAAIWLACVMLGAMWWTVTGVVWLLVPETTLGQLGMLLKLLGMPLLANGYWMLAHQLVNPLYRPSRMASVLLVGNPVLVLLLAVLPWTRSLIGQYVIHEGRPAWHLGLAFWLEIAACMSLLVITGMYESRAIRDGSGSMRGVLTSNLIGAIIPGIGALASLVILVHERGHWPGHAIEWMSVAFLGTALVDLWSFYWQGLLEGVPVARSVILEEMPDAVFFFDESGRLADHNRCAADLLSGSQDPHLWGMDEVVAALGPAVRPESGEYRLHEGRLFAEVDLRIAPVVSQGEQVGQAMVLRDISVANQSRRALAVANQRLREQVEEIDRLRDELAEQATRDSLTGVHNRRHLDRALANAVVAGPVTLILLDIDHFKAFNDRYGHLVGDEVLIGVAQRLAGWMTAEETLARFGGEEFVVISRQPGWEQSLHRARALQAPFFGSPISTTAGQLSVTVSAGLAMSGMHGHTPDELFRAADAALYRAKSRGRNRVEAPPDAED